MPRRLNHNPSSYDDGTYPSGQYKFMVTDVTLTTWRTGSPGMKVIIECHHDGQSFNVYENFTLVPKALFKVKEFCECLGVDFTDDDLDTFDFLHKLGDAELIKKEDSKFLEVDSWIPADSDAKKKASIQEANKVPF